MLTLFFYFPAPPVPNVFLDHFFPSSWAYLLSPPPSFRSWSTLTYLFAPSSSPHYFPVADRPCTWTAPPPAGRHCSSPLPSPSGWPKGFSYTSLFLPSSLRFPSLAVLDLDPGLSAPVFSHPGVLSSLCLPSSILTLAPPPAGLDWQPSPLPVPSGGGMLFFLPPLILLSLPYVFCVFSWFLLKC